MAQTGYTPILIYSSSTTTNAPAAGNLTNSTLGSELAINITDGKLFYKDNSNNVQVIAWKTTPTTAGGTGLTSYTAGDLLYYASGTTLTKLAIGASGRWLGSSGTAPQWNAPAALTKTDDTNVTLTLGGSASTALLNAASLTLGWTGTLAVSRGGTGTGTAFTTGSVVFAGASGVYSQDNANFFWDDTNNRLGLGTASPAVRFDARVSSSTAYNPSTAALNYIAQVYNPTSGASNNALYAAFTEANGEWYFGGVQNSGNTAADFVWVSRNAGARAERVRFFAAGGVSIGNTTDPGATNLSVTGTIQGGGKIFSQPGGYPISDFTGFGNNQGGYNDTTSKARLNLVGGVGDNGNRCGWTTYSIKTGGTGNGAEYYIRPVTWSGSAFAEQGSAGVYLQDNATSWSSASDERLKTDLQPIENAADKVMTLRAMTGRYAADDEQTSRVFLIAQDVQQVLPQAVSENCEGYLGLAYTDLIPLLVAAIKELKQDLSAAKTEIELLKA